MTKPPYYVEGGECHDRHTACHVECQRYKDWQVIHEAEKEQRYEIYHKERDIDTFEALQGSRIHKLNQARRAQEKARRR